MKRIVSVILAAVVFALGAFSASAFSHKDYPGLDFSNDFDDNLIVTGYTGENPVVVVPETVLGKSVLRIDTEALKGNTVVRKLVMNDNMTKVRAYGMRNCSALESVYYSKSLVVLEKYAFAYNPKLMSAFLRNTQTNELEVGVYYKTAVEYVSLPDTMLRLNNMAFQDTKLRIINIPDGATSIGNFCFADCPDLERVYIPASVTRIGTDAFLNSNKVTVYTEEGSAAQTYCDTNGINCSVITADEFPSRLLGDVNGDGELDINDVTYIQRELLDYKTDFYSDNCDYNGDCILNIDDATEIQLHLAGLK